MFDFLLIFSSEFSRFQIKIKLIRYHLSTFVKHGQAGQEKWSNRYGQTFIPWDQSQLVPLILVDCFCCVCLIAIYVYLIVAVFGVFFCICIYIWGLFFAQVHSLAAMEAGIVTMALTNPLQVFRSVWTSQAKFVRDTAQTWYLSQASQAALV